MSRLSDRFGRRSLLRLTGGLVGSSFVGTALTGLGVAQTAEWVRTYRYEGTVSGVSDAVRTDAGGYVASGWAWEETLDPNAWLFGLDADGDLAWSRRYDAEAGDRARWGEASALAELPGGYAFVADDAEEGSGFWVVVTDREGSVRRSEFVDLPAAGTVEGVDVLADDDGGFTVLAAGTETWLVGVDADLEPRWRRSYELGDPVELVRPADGGYAVAVTRWSAASERDDGADYRLLRTDGEGERCWDRTYDNGGAEDVAGGLAERRRGGETVGYALAGRSDDVVWVLTTDADGSLRRSRTFDPVPEGDQYHPGVADVEFTGGGYTVFGDSVERYWLAEADIDLGLRWEAFYDSGYPWFDDHASQALVTGDGEYGLFGELYDGGDEDTSQALVVNVAGTE